MNQVFKDRKGDFDGYYEFRRAKMGVNSLAPYDLFLQLMKNPDKKTSYIDALKEIEASLGQMDPAFDQAFKRRSQATLWMSIRIQIRKAVYRICPGSLCSEASCTRVPEL